MKWNIRFLNLFSKNFDSFDYNCISMIGHMIIITINYNDTNSILSKKRVCISTFNRFVHVQYRIDLLWINNAYESKYDETCQRGWWLVTIVTLKLSAVKKLIEYFFIITFYKNAKKTTHTHFFFLFAKLYVVEL